MNGEAPKPQLAKDTPLESRDADHWTNFFRNRVPWYELPTFLGLVRVFGIRDRMRKRNLQDTTNVASAGPLPAVDETVRHLDARTPDGTLNDLETPTMGAVETRFGRNVPLESTIPEPEPQHCQRPARASSAAS